jgi:hypothetical protein
VPHRLARTPYFVARSGLPSFSEVFPHDLIWKGAASFFFDSEGFLSKSKPSCLAKGWTKAGSSNAEV